MRKRKLRIVRRTPPAIGVCEHCNSQFWSSKSPLDEAKKDIEAQFGIHKCNPLDSSQNALRVVREATEGK